MKNIVGNLPGNLSGKVFVGDFNIYRRYRKRWCSFWMKIMMRLHNRTVNLTIKWNRSHLIIGIESIKINTEKAIKFWLKTRYINLRSKQLSVHVPSKRSTI